jgi:hypothetical protein
MRLVLVGLYDFATEVGSYPSVDTIEDLRHYLEPEYLRHLPTLDGWGRPLHVRCVTRGCVLRSLGADGLLDEGPRAAIARGDRDVVRATASSLLENEDDRREDDPEQECE